ncbi:MULTISPECIES: hypothetical protein [unclassified Gilliamella]|nr:MULTISPECIES: hypothetical protein [unclassified Gilliamella]
MIKIASRERSELAQFLECKKHTKDYVSKIVDAIFKEKSNSRV